jgi:hypothetical protein
VFSLLLFCVEGVCVFLVGFASFPSFLARFPLRLLLLLFFALLLNPRVFFFLLDTAKAVPMVLFHSLYLTQQFFICNMYVCPRTL